MKLKNIFFLTALSLLINFSSCKKEEPQVSLKDLPKCTIFDLEDGSVYCHGETVILSYEVEQGKEKIKDVKFFINDIRYIFSYSDQYDNSSKKFISFRVPDDCEGNVRFKITVTDEKNNTVESTLEVPVVDERPDIESPDIVSFDDGICPNAFKLYGWTLNKPFMSFTDDPTVLVGYDDDFSLVSASWLYSIPRYVQTTKTFTADINLVEYYTRGTVRLSINNKDQDVSEKGDDTWIKNYSYLPAGTHTFRWYASAYKSAKIDAIRFINNIQSPDYIPEKEFPWVMPA